MSSIKEVAREAGVSIATVSHVINNTRFVSDKVRARVVKAIEQCRYYPNAHARGLASGRTKIIGLVISDIANPFFPDLVKAIEEAAFERGFETLLSNTNYETERASKYVRRLIERNVAGVAVMTSEMSKELIDELARREVPVVFLDVGKTGKQMSNLQVDYEAGIEQAILHLVALGHRRIAFISGRIDIRSSRRRLEAFQRAMKQLFPEIPELIFYGNFKIEGGRRAAHEILMTQADNLPTAVVAANDLTAIGAINEFESAGLKVPADISVIGFDDIDFAALTKPALTTVSLPRNELGRRAVEMLFNALDNPREEGTEIKIPTNLIIRQSTAPARIQPANEERGKLNKRQRQAV